MKIVRQFFFGIISLSACASVGASTSCAGIAQLDSYEKLGGALEFMMGCRGPVTGQVLRDHWEDFPEVAQEVLIGSFVVPNAKQTAATDPRLGVLIGDGSGLMQRMLAFSNRDTTPEMAEIWEEVAPDGNWESEFEEAWYGHGLYFEERGEISWAPSNIRLTSLMASSDVPFFAVFYARMMQDGRFVVGDETEFLAIYDSFKDQDIEAAWLKADYLASKIAEGDNSYRQYETEIMKLLEFASERGSIAAMFTMADVLNRGDIVDMDEPGATKIYQRLAQYGVPSAQRALGVQLMNGWGIQRNEALGEEWIRLAAKSGNAAAFDVLFERATEKADFKEAIKWAMHNAEMGYLGFSANGYLAVKAMLSHLELSGKDLDKFNKYLRFHCETSITVVAHEDCSVLGSISKSFRSRPTLIDAARDPSILRLVDDFELDTGRYIALVVANDEYEFWDSLETPRRDAELVGSILESQYGFEVTYLKNASRRDTLRALYDMASDIQFNDHFLLYYAGHGVVDRATDTAYWIPSSASRDFRPDWISSAEIMTSLKAIPSRHLLLVADSCYSGKLLRGAAPTEGNPGVAVIQRLFSKKARVAITSGGDEPVQDASSGGQHSVFANAFARALNDADGPTPSSTIFNDVLGAVSLEASQTPQYADMRELGHDGGDFIFVPGAGQ